MPGCPPPSAAAKGSNILHDASAGNKSVLTASPPRAALPQPARIVCTPGLTIGSTKGAKVPHDPLVIKEWASEVTWHPKAQIQRSVPNRLPGEQSFFHMDRRNWRFQDPSSRLRYRERRGSLYLQQGKPARRPHQDYLSPTLRSSFRLRCQDR